MLDDDLDRNRLRELFNYDPETGNFTWKVKRGKMKPGDQAGYLRKDGYIRLFFDYSYYQAHRLAMIYMGRDIQGLHVDHINGIPSDNRIENLRAVRHAENMRNMRMPKSNKSGVCGVQAAGEKWIASIRFERKVIHLGTFSNIEDAISARKNAERNYGYHENHGRKP
ncbi:TPA: HNH endonuclease [Pseudomonas aeruginosa]